MAKETTIIKSIVELILGKKYYANVINVKGTNDIELTSFIHRDKESALKHKRDIESTHSFMWVEMISFRSRKEY